MTFLEMLLHDIQREAIGPMRQSELLRMIDDAIEFAKTECNAQPRVNTDCASTSGRRD